MTDDATTPHHDALDRALENTEAAVGQALGAIFDSRAGLDQIKERIRRAASLSPPAQAAEARRAMTVKFEPTYEPDVDAVGMGDDADAPRKDPIRVLIVDDHALFRRGLSIVLAAEDDIQVVGEAGDGSEAVDKAADLLPDIVLMDVRMPKRSGIEACSSVKEVAPSAKIIMLTISDEEADLYNSIKAGATGYLLKEISADKIADAIRAVADGQTQISPSMASKLLTEFKSMHGQTDTQRLAPPKLTDREINVLKLVATGMNNRDIAKKLFISENTVKNHVRNILDKLQLHSRMEAVVYAMRENILEAP
jgi:two-component system NarL family response regulator